MRQRQVVVERKSDGAAATMFTETVFAERMTRLNEERRLHFYEVFAHNLTVAIRSIWSETSLSADEKLERIKWVNEILHGATAKVWALRLKTHEWTDSDFGSDIAHYLRLHPGISQEVVNAIQRSYDAVRPTQS